MRLHSLSVNYPQVKGQIDHSSTFVQKAGQQLLNGGVLRWAGHQQRGVELHSAVTLEDVLNSLPGHVPQQHGLQRVAQLSTSPPSSIAVIHSLTERRCKQVPPF